jgi:hypothetical protein
MPFFEPKLYSNFSTRKVYFIQVTQFYLKSPHMHTYIYIHRYVYRQRDWPHTHLPLYELSLIYAINVARKRKKRNAHGVLERKLSL